MVADYAGAKYQYDKSREEKISSALLKIADVILNIS